MGLNAVLVDRARVVTKASTGKRVEGTTRVATVHGAWFRARLFLEGAPEAAPSARRRQHTTASPQLMFAIRDSNGDPVLVTADLQLEIESAQLGHKVWQVTGDPQPIRKKRTVIGFLGDVRRLDEHETPLESYR